MDHPFRLFVFWRENRDSSDWTPPPQKEFWGNGNGNGNSEFKGNGKHATIPWPFANAIPRMAKGMTIAAAVMFFLISGWTWTLRNRNSRDFRFETWGSIFESFFWFSTKYKLGRFLYLLRLCSFCKALRDMRKFPQKCQKIAGCWECAVYGSRPPIASTPGSSSPEWPGLDNITSQPWSDATCPCTTSWSTYFRFVTLFLLKKTRQSTSSSVTGASCVRPWLTRDIV